VGKVHPSALSGSQSRNAMKLVDRSTVGFATRLSISHNFGVTTVACLVCSMLAEDFDFPFPIQRHRSMASSKFWMTASCAGISICTFSPIYLVVDDGKRLSALRKRYTARHLLQMHGQSHIRCRMMARPYESKHLQRRLTCLQRRVTICHMWYSTDESHGL